MLAAAAALGGATTARARQAQPDERPQDGPIVVGERKGALKWFELPRVHAAADGYWRYTQQSQTATGQPTLEDRESYYQATLDLDGEAYIGHKNLLDVTGAFRLGVQGTNFDSDTQGDSYKDNSLAVFYDIAGLLLQEGPMPVTLYARKQQQNTDREFLSTVQTDTQEYGAVGRLRSTIAPTTVQLFHRDEDQTDLLGDVDYSLTQDTAIVQSQARLTDTQQIELSYEFDHVNEHQNDVYNDEYDRNDGTLVHQLNFGEADQSTLRSSLRYYEQTGLYAQNDVRLDEQMFLRHSNKFNTQYNLTLQDQDLQGQNQQFARLNGTLAYTLFDSLTATAFLGGSSTNISDQFQSDEIFTGGALDYTKRVPWGRLDLNVGAGINRQNNSDQSAPVNISNQPARFVDPFPVTLNHQNVIASSIVVTDTARIRVYQEGTDYTVQSMPDLTQLTRVVGGAIVNGEAVLVSYQIGPEPANTQTTVNSRFLARYSLTEGWLNGVSVYAIYRTQNETIDAANPSQFVLNDINEWRYGVDYRNGPVSLVAERIDFDSTIQPYTSTRFEARLDQRLGLSSSLSGIVTHQTIDYTDPVNLVTLNLARIDWAQRISNELDFIARLQYRDQSDTLSGNTNGLEEVLEVRWHKRQTSVYTTINNSSLNSPGNDTLSLAFTIGMRRDF